MTVVGLLDGSGAVGDDDFFVPCVTDDDDWCILPAEASFSLLRLQERMRNFSCLQLPAIEELLDDQCRLLSTRKMAALRSWAQVKEMLQPALKPCEQYGCYHWAAKLARAVHLLRTGRQFVATCRMCGCFINCEKGDARLNAVQLKKIMASSAANMSTAGIMQSRCGAVWQGQHSRRAA